MRLLIISLSWSLPKTNSSSILRGTRSGGKQCLINGVRCIWISSSVDTAGLSTKISKLRDAAITLCFLRQHLQEGDVPVMMITSFINATLPDESSSAEDDLPRCGGFSFVLGNNASASAV